MFESKDKEEEVFVSINEDLIMEIFEGIINDHLPIKIRKSKIIEFKVATNKQGIRSYTAKVRGYLENSLNRDWRLGSFENPNYSFYSRNRLPPTEAFKRSRTIKKILSDEVEEMKDENKVRRIPKKKSI